MYLYLFAFLRVCIFILAFVFISPWHPQVDIWLIFAQIVPWIEVNCAFIAMFIFELNRNSFEVNCVFIEMYFQLKKMNGVPTVMFEFLAIALNRRYFKWTGNYVSTVILILSELFLNEREIMPPLCLDFNLIGTLLNEWGHQLTLFLCWLVLKLNI